MIPDALHARMAMAVTAYDRAESVKPSYNIYALPQLLGRVAEVMADVDRGAPVRAAVMAAFTGRLLAAVLKGIGEPRLTSEEREAKSRSFGGYQPVTADVEA
jgi:hypothetical protein